LDDGDPALFPKLTDAQLDLLRHIGTVRVTEAGDVLFREGDRTSDVMAVLQGTVEITVGSGDAKRLLVLQRARDLMAELSVFTKQEVGATGTMLEPGLLLVVSPEDFRDLVGAELDFGDFVLQMLFRRRRALERIDIGVRIVGSSFDPDTRRLREFATRNRVVHHWIDADDPQQSLGDQLGGPVGTTVLLSDGTALTNPTNAEFAFAVGLSKPGPTAETFDVVIVGAGPGGLAASVYGAAGGLTTAVLDAVAVGGQAATSARIENYLGFPAGISGAELAQRAQLQAQKFGVELMVPRRAVGLSEDDGFYSVSLEDGEPLAAQVVILALGVQYRRLPIPHISDYEGLGVTYAADSAREQTPPGGRVVVVGGANSAGQAALSLREAGHHVSLVIRAGALAKGMARYLRDRISVDPAIEVLLHSEVREVEGSGKMQSVTIEDTEVGRRRKIPADTMVVLIGAVPPTEWLGGEIALDDDGFILTGQDLAPAIGGSAQWRELGRAPFLLETSRPGIFAVGDVRSGSTKMVAPSVGEGGMAIRLAAEHLAQWARRR
jgi:thioredoxin reductase (NADPH)